MEAIGWGLRPATSADVEFLRTLFADTNIMLRGLPLEVRTPLIDMQHRSREWTYSTEYPEAQNLIVRLDDGARVGRLLMHREPETFRIIDLAILPQWQGRGIGTEILKDLIEQCLHNRVKLNLRVTKENPALKLYSRLGFQVEGGDEISCEMCWHGR